jgi:peroxiredoxin
MGLRQRLAQLMGMRPAVYQKLSRDLSERLRETALPGVLKPGDRMPEFVLPDAEGNLVYSGDLIARGPLVVVFFRGDWCPFCRMTLVALNEVLPAIVAAGGTLVALTPDIGEHTHATFHDLGLTFPVLSDLDSATALEFGTNYLVPDAVRHVQEANGLDLAVRHGDGAWFLPMPATFVSDREGIIRFAYASGDVTDRLEPDDIVAAVGKLSTGF